MDKTYSKVVAIVPAAGLGLRFGGKVKKTFRELDGKPVLARTLEALERTALITEIIPALRPEDHGLLRDLISRYGIQKVKRIAPGGKERQDSVWSALKLVSPDAETVAVHDGVRPMATPEFMSGVIEALYDEGGIRWDGVVPGLMPKDTIKEVLGKEVLGEGAIKTTLAVRTTLDRRSLVAVQTPQVFRYESLMSAYEKAMARGYYATDDAALVEAAGGRVKVAPGIPENIKITAPVDIILSEALLLFRR